MKTRWIGGFPARGRDCRTERQGRLFRPDPGTADSGRVLRRAQEVLRLREVRRGRNRRAEGEGVNKANSHGTASFDIIPSVVDVLKKVLIETGKETEYDS